MDILYLALFPGRAGNDWSRGFFEGSHNRLVDLLPDAAQWADIVRVIDLPVEQAPDATLTLWASSLDQKVLCYLGRPEQRSAGAGGAPATEAAESLAVLLEGAE
jgi:hypothetical protein